MQKNFLSLFVYSFVLFIFSSCGMINSAYNDTNPHFKGFERTGYEIKMLFIKTTYPKIYDEDIVSVSDAPFGTGKLITVNYKYGTQDAVGMFYKDSDGDLVGVKSGKYKKYGYPYADSFIYKINEHGNVVIDWVCILFLAFIIGIFYRVASA